MTSAPNPSSSAPADSELRQRVTALRLYEAEVALHIAHQTGDDAWISAASDKLHHAIVASIAAAHDWDRRTHQPPLASNTAMR